MEPGLEAMYVYDPPNFSWPAGAHVAVVEVDTETGDVQLLRYVAIDDLGTVINLHADNALTRTTLNGAQVAGGVDDECVHVYVFKGWR